jgi:hypothetical protein
MSLTLQERDLPTHFQSEPCRSFMQHWMALPKLGLIPDSAAYLDSSPAALMPSVIIQEILPQGLLVRFFGTALERRWQHDITGNFFAENFPPEARNRIYSNACQIVSHPCGLHQIVEAHSNFGKDLYSEAIVLPLAVGKGRVPRVIGFSNALSVTVYKEYFNRFKSNTLNEWIDIGAGTPASQPFSQ